MPIIKNQEIAENTWSFIADDAPLSDGDITVSSNRWNSEKTLLLQHCGKVGVRLQPGDSLNNISDDLSKIDLVELTFPAFTDGRLFSAARLLRDKFNYRGEIRAVGHYLADQVYYLHRVGVDTFEFENPQDLQVALNAINDFSVRYQNSSH